MQLRNQKGFTLIEIAIVLTIVGLVIGGIWLAASTVLNNNKKSELSRQVIQVVQNTKNLFVNQTGNNPATGLNRASALNAGVFPAGMVVGGIVRHPFATNNLVNATDLNGAGSVVTLTIGTAAQPIPRDACTEVISTIATQQNFQRYGLTSVGGGGTAITSANVAAANFTAINAACAAASILTIAFNVP